MVRTALYLYIINEMERGLGLARDAAAVVTTDSSANWQVATRHASANKVRHALRRWRVLSERLESRECKLVTLPGVNTPADFMTRKTGRKKVNASVDFATNARNTVPSRKKKN